MVTTTLHKAIFRLLIALTVLSMTVSVRQAAAQQQKELGEVNILTAVSNMAFSALWVAGRKPGLYSMKDVLGI